MSEESEGRPSGEGFGRWSRRKRAAATPAPAAPALDPAGLPPAGRPAASGDATVLRPLPSPAAPAFVPASLPTTARPGAPGDAAHRPPPLAAPEFDLAELPAIDSLTAASDVTVFLRPQVPAALRHAALRRAWILDPAIRNHVGPADYAWDFNAPDGMPGFSLELGGGVRELLAQAIGLPREEEAEATPPEPLPDPAREPVLAVAEPAPVRLDAPADPPPPEPAPQPLRPRRHGGAVPV